MFGIEIVERLCVLAGMPGPLPDDWHVVDSLTTITRERLQSVSFFLFAFLIFTIIVQGLWNVLAKDFKALPRLHFGTALILVVFLGTMFVLVLTMISGARELLTPGAWHKKGWTYSLEPEKVEASKDEKVGEDK